MSDELGLAQHRVVVDAGQHHELATRDPFRRLEVRGDERGVVEVADQHHRGGHDGAEALPRALDLALERFLVGLRVAGGAHERDHERVVGVARGPQPKPEAEQSVLVVRGDEPLVLGLELGLVRPVVPVHPRAEERQAEHAVGVEHGDVHRGSATHAAPDQVRLAHPAVVEHGQRVVDDRVVLRGCRRSAVRPDVEPDESAGGCQRRPQLVPHARVGDPGMQQEHDRPLPAGVLDPHLVRTHPHQLLHAADATRRPRARRRRCAVGVRRARVQVP